ncbi:MAG: hypothetical protein HOQ11_06175 [Gemmatimonadaceae bacterium]|nr:hypothetical protein [Gemmatimonadaceae bacterium]NUR19576.1 hypothetical protein [Gemmatimonadaceae bacterium]NUS96974.1 hypothetical protein [Gemmatimonadaceae bacterium]
MQLAKRRDVGLKGDTPSSAMEASRASSLDQSGDLLPSAARRAPHAERRTPRAAGRRSIIGADCARCRRASIPSRDDRHRYCVPNMAFLYSRET